MFVLSSATLSGKTDSRLNTCLRLLLLDQPWNFLNFLIKFQLILHCLLISFTSKNNTRIPMHFPVWEQYLKLLFSYHRLGFGIRFRPYLIIVVKLCPFKFGKWDKVTGDHVWRIRVVTTSKRCSVVPSTGRSVQRFVLMLCRRNNSVVLSGLSPLNCAKPLDTCVNQI